MGFQHPISPASVPSGTSRLISLWTLALIAAFLGLNCGLNILNKWALGIYGFNFPLLLTTCHMAFCFLTLSLPMIREPFLRKHRTTVGKQWRGLTLVGVSMAANVALNNLSLVSMSLSLNQVIRSSMPVCTCLLAICIENKIPSKLEGTSLTVLSVGVMGALWEGTMTSNVSGIALCCAATVCNATMSSLTGRVMSEKVDALRLTFYIAPVSCAVTAPFYFYFEHGRMKVYWLEHKAEVVLVILITSVVALAYNVVHSALIHKTSAVTVTVLGEVKIVAILLLSAFILGEDRIFSVKMTCGVAMAVVGFVLYSHAKIMNAHSCESVHPGVEIKRRLLA